MSQAAKSSCVHSATWVFSGIDYRPVGNTTTESIYVMSHRHGHEHLFAQPIWIGLEGAVSDTSLKYQFLGSLYRDIQCLLLGIPLLSSPKGLFDTKTHETDFSL